MLSGCDAGNSDLETSVFCTASYYDVTMLIIISIELYWATTVLEKISIFSTACGIKGRGTFYVCVVGVRCHDLHDVMVKQNHASIK